MESEFQNPSWYNTIKPYAEFAYYLSGIVLAIFAPFVYKQFKLTKVNLNASFEALKIAKEDVNLRTQREAATLAVELCNKFTDKMNTDYRGYINEIAQFAHIENWSLKDYNFNKNSFKDPQKAEEWFSSATLHTARPLVFLANELETYSYYFLNGIADEKIAYSIIGEMYCVFIKQILPFLIFNPRPKAFESKNHPYKLLLNLYKLWHERLSYEKTNLELLEKKELIRELENKTSSIQPREVPPLGIFSEKE